MMLIIIRLILDELVKSQISTLFVIPAKAGIQFVFNEKAKPFCITPKLGKRWSYAPPVCSLALLTRDYFV